MFYSFLNRHILSFVHLLLTNPYLNLQVRQGTWDSGIRITRCFPFSLYVVGRSKNWYHYRLFPK